MTCADVQFAQHSESSCFTVAMLMPALTQVGDRVDIGFNAKPHVGTCVYAVRAAALALYLDEYSCPVAPTLKARRPLQIYGSGP